MKHNVMRINSYSYVREREQIDWTLFNQVSYSVEKNHGKIRGFIKVRDVWVAIDKEEAKAQYEHILKVIESEMKKEC